MINPASDPQFSESPLHGVSAQTETLRRALRAGTYGIRRTAVDIGAHIGIWSRLLREFGFASVHAFEPVDENWDCLIRNVHQGTWCHKYALGFTSGWCKMKNAPDNNSGQWVAHFIGPFACNGAEMRQLDSFADITNVDLIKIDVEGREGDVILGGRSLISEYKPVIVFEDNGLGQKYFGEDWIDPKPILSDLGYKRFARERKDEIWRYG